MQKKNKKKLLIKLISLSLVLFLNSGILGNVAKAAEVVIDETCYFEYYDDQTKYDALGLGCEQCIVNTQNLIDADKANCKDTLDQDTQACDTDDILASYCDTLSGSQQTACKACANKEPGPDRDSCKGNYDTSKYTSDYFSNCKKEHQETYDKCVKDSTAETYRKCNVCKEKLEAAAAGACKDFTEFVDEIKAEVKNDYDAKYL
ncbi:hypothetical protein ACFLZH_02630, partial [Patescibacteria group bacterium]